MILVTPEDFKTQYSLAQSNAGEDVLQSYIDSLVSGETITLRKLLGKELADLLIAYIATGFTSGALVAATEYVIVDYKDGDDFTNVGATANETGQFFTATGTTPTNYTQGSTLRVVVQRYEDLINPFYIEVDCSCMWWRNYFEQLIANSHGLKDLLTIQIYYSYLFGEQVNHSQSGVAIQSVENGKVSTPMNAVRKGEQKWNTAGLDTWYAVYWFCKFKYPDIYPEFKGVMEYARSTSFL